MTNNELINKLNYLEEKCNDMQSQIEKQNKIITNSAFETYVTPVNLAKIMNCSINTIYIKIRQGVIKSTKKVGNLRIPLSQFDLDIQEEISNTLSTKSVSKNVPNKYEEAELPSMNKIKNKVWSDKFLN